LTVFGAISGYNSALMVSPFIISMVTTGFFMEFLLF
jgi:hypothetical protein